MNVAVYGTNATGLKRYLDDHHVRFVDHDLTFYTLGRRLPGQQIIVNEKRRLGHAVVWVMIRSGLGVTQQKTKVGSSVFVTQLISLGRLK